MNALPGLGLVVEVNIESTSWWGSLLLLVLFLFLTALGNAFETSLVALNDSEVRREAQEGKGSAKRIVRWMDSIGRFRSTLRSMTTLFGLFYGALALAVLPRQVAQWIPALPVWLWVVILAIVLTSLFILLAELLPSRIVVKNPHRFAHVGVCLFDFLRLLFLPILWLVDFLYRPLAKQLNLNADRSDQMMTEEALRSMLDASSEAGHIEAEDKDMIENVFEFDDTTVAEVMTHRTEMSILKMQAQFAEVLDIVLDEQYSRFPVINESIDDIVGILHTKDLLTYLDKADAFDMNDVMRQPFFTPESRNIKALFADMKQNRVQMAIVIDEYGGTAGLVTFEDLLEQLVGSIEDEYDNERRLILQVAPDAWVIDGSTDLETVGELVAVEFPDEYETLSGFVVDVLDRIPDEDERPECVYQNIRFKVLAMEDNRIHRLKVTKLASEKAVDENEGNKQ